MGGEGREAGGGRGRRALVAAGPKAASRKRFGVESIGWP